MFLALTILGTYSNKNWQKTMEKKFLLNITVLVTKRIVHLLCSFITDQQVHINYNFLTIIASVFYTSAALFWKKKTQTIPCNFWWSCRQVIRSSYYSKLEFRKSDVSIICIHLYMIEKKWLIFELHVNNSPSYMYLFIFLNNLV